MPTMQHTARQMLELMPGLGPLHVLRAWAGVIERTPDGYPIIDAPGHPAGFITASGFGGNGFGLGPATGKVASELAMNGASSIDIRGLRLGRFAEQPAWRREGYDQWRQDPEHDAEPGAWDVLGARPLVARGNPVGDSSRGEP
jgi:sarcosine oxidase subunit beta